MNVHLAGPGQLADLHLALLLNGVYTTPRGMINLSTALSPRRPRRHRRRLRHRLHDGPRARIS